MSGEKNGLTRQNPETNNVQINEKPLSLQVPNRKEMTPRKCLINGLYFSFNDTATGQ